MYSFNQKKWKRYVLKQAMYPCFSGLILSAIVFSALQKSSISELVLQAKHGMYGMLIVLVIFIFWATTDNWLEDRKRTDFPLFTVTPDYLTLTNGLFEERVKTEHVESFKVEKKGKHNSYLSIILKDESSLTIEEFFPIEEIAKELRTLGVNEL